MTDGVAKRGFGSDRKRASEAGKKAKLRQTPSERKERARQAAKARWDNRKLDNNQLNETGGN